MVTPKQSQRILVWCIESALNLLVDLFESQSKKIRHSELTSYFNQELEGKGIDRRKISRVTYELQRHGYLEIGEGDSVQLTDKAKIRVIDKYVKLNEPDGKRRLVSFDIPEVKRRERDKFRRTIKNMGFRQVQKSLWVCNQNVGDLVEIAAKEYKVDKYVAYFIIEASNIDKYIGKLLTKPKQ